MSNGILYGSAGKARVGKGSFVSLLRDIVWQQDPGRGFTSFAFATALKTELDPFLIETYGISAFTTDTAQKTIIRPHLVERGAGARKEDPDHWIKLIAPGVKEALARGDVVTVEDVRYPNEANWVHSLGGKIVYIERTIDGIPVPPANQEEADFDWQTKRLADYTISWATFTENPLDMMRPYVLNAWSQLNQPVNSTL